MAKKISIIKKEELGSKGRIKEQTHSNLTQVYGRSPVHRYQFKGRL